MSRRRSPWARLSFAYAAFQASSQRDERTRSGVYTTAETVLAAYTDPGVLASALTSELRAARLLDEVFVTVTDAVIDESQHDGVLKIFDFGGEGAKLVAEGAIAPDSAWRFRRWRFNER